MADLGSVLKAAVAQKASDIFLVVDQPPLVRFNGGMAVLQGFPPMNGQDTGRLILSSLFEEQRRILSENLELDCTFTAPGLGRFRMNVTTQQKGLHAVLRLIPPTIPTPEELEFPEALSALADLPRGLVLVTGPAGSGRSTTLLCLIEQINRKRSAHIVTIEDPIEFFLTPRHSVICQREIGTHTKSYAAGLHSVLKQNADVVLGNPGPGVRRGGPAHRRVGTAGPGCPHRLDAYRGAPGEPVSVERHRQINCIASNLRPHRGPSAQGRRPGDGGRAEI